MNKKYKLTSNFKMQFGIKLFQIEALKDFSIFKKGEKGGWIEKKENLSQGGDAWVYGNAQVSGDAWVYGNARVYGNAQVYGNAWVYGNAQVYGNARVYGNAQVSGDAQVYGNAWVYGNAQVYGRFDLTCNIDFELPRINIDSKEKLKQLKDFLTNFNKKKVIKAKRKKKK
jgi:carbonic anhydrase/acetyltransferase-like protein (isoleucine patch superfamily)